MCTRARKEKMASRDPLTISRALRITTVASLTIWRIQIFLFNLASPIIGGSFELFIGCKIEKVKREDFACYCLGDFKAQVT